MKIINLRFANKNERKVARANEFAAWQDGNPYLPPR